MFPQRNRLLARVKGSFSGAQCFPFASLRSSHTAGTYWVLTRVGGSDDKSSLFPLEAWILVSQGLLATP